VSWQPNNGLIMAAVSSAGDLLFSTNETSQEHTIGWVDADGAFVDLIDVPGYLFAIDLSPDSRFAAVEWLTVDSSEEIWIAELQRHTLSRLSRFDSDSWGPKFSPDGRRVAYTNQTPGSECIYAHGIDGATDPKVLVELNTLGLHVSDWSEDGNLLFYYHSVRRTDTAQISVYDFTTGETRSLLEADFSQSQAALSPDGRWLAYVSMESGSEEVYVRPYPALNRKWRISVSGGSRPEWNSAGTQLLYATETGEFYAVSISTDGEELVASTPRFMRSFGRDYAGIAVDAAHERFLVARRKSQRAPTPLHFISNWRATFETDSP
jgi:Tol biopolymer transport system component